MRCGRAKLPIYYVLIVALQSLAEHSSSATINHYEEHDIVDIVAQKSASSLQDRIHRAKIELWKRGAFSLDENVLVPTDKTLNKKSRLEVIVHEMENMVRLAPIRLGPIRKMRHDLHISGTAERYSSIYGDLSNLINMRGGADDVLVDEEEKVYDLELKLKQLGEKFGSDFNAAIDKNIQEHQSDCKLSCESFYCADEGVSNEVNGWNQTSFVSYSMGPVPPEDFAGVFGFPLDLIKVSKEAIFTSSEAANVVSMAEEEGISHNEFPSGKYKLGGDWLLNLPRTRAWFNDRLKSTLFPLLAGLFPEIISSPRVLRAHSVSLLKYNSSHPRTDVHVDNGILAMTLAMTPINEYKGGGTFFEHMGVDNVLPMDVGGGTFRPGSVRHGGHRVGRGTRYILGAFLLIEDRVEHVRRLKNRGAKLRRAGDLDGAVNHFKWALALNPKCTTCLKDWAEILHFRKDFVQAEVKIRKVLELLEEQDSDALFTLGLLLSELGKDDESIAAYQKSVKLNAEDAELCYNLGIKFGEKGDVREEMEMYSKATSIDPTMGGAWINWGTCLAEKGDFDAAEHKFKRALLCSQEVAPKAMLNLALVYQANANKFVASGNLEAAKKAIFEATKYLNTAKPLLDLYSNQNNPDDDLSRYVSQFKPLRLQVHRLAGQILAGLQDFPACEAEFRSCTINFPDEPGAWHMLSRILEVQGKTAEANVAKEKLNAIMALKGGLAR